MVAALYLLSFALIGLLGTSGTVQQPLNYMLENFSGETRVLVHVLAWLALTEATVRLVTIFIPRIQHEVHCSGRGLLIGLPLGMYLFFSISQFIQAPSTDFSLIIGLLIPGILLWVSIKTDWLDVIFLPRVFRLLIQVEKMIESREFERAYTTLTKTKLSDSPWHWAELGSLYDNEEWEGYDPDKATEAFRRSYDAYDPIGSVRLGARIADKTRGSVSQEEYQVAEDALRNRADKKLSGTKLSLGRLLTEHGDESARQEGLKLYEEITSMKVEDENDRLILGLVLHNLGVCHRDGIGTEPDAERAAIYFAESVKVGGDIDDHQDTEISELFDTVSAENPEPEELSRSLDRLVELAGQRNIGAVPALLVYYVQHEPGNNTEIYRWYHLTNLLANAKLLPEMNLDLGSDDQAEFDEMLSNLQPSQKLAMNNYAMEFVQELTAPIKAPR